MKYFQPTDKQKRRGIRQMPVCIFMEMYCLQGLSRRWGGMKTDTEIKILRNIGCGWEDCLVHLD